MMPSLCLIAALAAAPAGPIPPVVADDPPSMNVRVNGDTLVQISPLEKIDVKGEEHVLGDGLPKNWAGGVSPKMVLGPIDTGTRLPLALDPSSMVVRSRDGVVYQEGRDYVLDHYWGGLGRVASGRIKADQTVLLDYRVSLQRIDAIQMSEEGVVSIKKGEPARVCPTIPEVDAGCKRIANIFLPYNATAVTQDRIYTVEDPNKTWRDYIRVEGKPYLANSRKLLRQGGNVKIVCFGDSVTAGASASSPDTNYVGALRIELRKAFPNTTVQVVNAGIGGSNTDQRLPNMDNEVLSFNPDLVVVEFVNDMGFPKEKLRSNYSQLIDRVRAKNPSAEVIILTPHFTRPDWMGTFHDSCRTLREIAAEKKVGLGDTAAIWGGLRGLGIPYEALLANEINHPNDLGHRFYVETVMALLL